MSVCCASTITPVLFEVKLPAATIAPNWLAMDEAVMAGTASVTLLAVTLVEGSTVVMLASTTTGTLPDTLSRRRRAAPPLLLLLLLALNNSGALTRMKGSST